MDDTLLFIPPCCVDKKLPRAVMQAPQRNLMFYTHGDVMMEKFYRAVSHLVIDRHVMVLTMPVIQADTAVFLRQCFERKWISHLVLSTYRNADVFIIKFLSEFRSRMLYVMSEDVSDLSSHMVLYNRDRSLVLCGPMLDRPQPSIRLASYNMTFYPMNDLMSTRQDWGHSLRNVLFPDVLRHRKPFLAQHLKHEDATLDHFLHLEFPPINEPE